MQLYRKCSTHVLFLFLQGRGFKGLTCLWFQKPKVTFTYPGLECLNVFLHSQRFSMESATQSLHPCSRKIYWHQWTSKMPLLHIPIFPYTSDFYILLWATVIFNLVTLPIQMKVLSPVPAILHSQGVHTVGCLDDLLLKDCSIQALMPTYNKLCKLCISLGGFSILRSPHWI